MSTSNPLIDRLQAYCRNKFGSVGYGKKGQFYLRYDLFAHFYLYPISYPLPFYVKLYSKNDDGLQQLQIAYSGILISNDGIWERPNQKRIKVLLDGSVPESVIYSLIDQSYQLLYDDLSEADKQFLVLRTQNLSLMEFLQKLITIHDLEHRSVDIFQLIKPAILLTTHAVDEASIPIGRSKIGGFPDLPFGWEWPIVDGHLLGFIGQINLLDIPSSLLQEKLPETGILYFFSFMAWLLDTDSLNHAISYERYNDSTLIRVLYFAGDSTSVQRGIKPDKMNIRPIRTAEVADQKDLSLPNSNYDDPSFFTSRGWTTDEYERYADLDIDFNTIRQELRHYRAHYQMLGYESPVQVPVVNPTETLLFQVDSDNEIETMWEDTGAIYFIIEENDLKRRDFSKVRAEYQGT